MVEHTLKDHGRRIIQVEEGLNKLQVSHAESKGWAGQLRNPQTLIIVVSFIAAMLGIEIIWPTL